MSSNSQIQKLILETLEANKAEKIESIDVSGKSQITDHIIIASAISERHALSLAEKIAQDLKDKKYENPMRIEGGKTSGWVILDGGSFMLHLFTEEMRDRYKLEDIINKIARASSLEGDEE